MEEKLSKSREVNPEFLKRLDTVQKQNGIKFKNMKEFDEFVSRK